MPRRKKTAAGKDDGGERGKGSDERRRGVARFGKLFDEQHHKEGGECKVHARERKRNELPRDGSDDAAQNPIQVVEQGDRAVKRACVCAFRYGTVRKERIGFVGQRKDQIRFPCTDVFKTRDKRKTVHDVADIDEEFRERDRTERRTRRKQADGDVLSRTRVHRYAHNRRDPHRIARVYDHQTEGDPDRRITEQNRNSDFCRFGEISAFHYILPYCLRFRYAVRSISFYKN